MFLGMTAQTLRPVDPTDLPTLFEHQADPIAARSAAFPSRDRAAFGAHWKKILADEDVITRTILLGDEVAGNVCSYTLDELRLVGYWVGREFWGRGVATLALTALLVEDPTRPLQAFVLDSNVGSIRVLEKCGFRLDVERSDEEQLLYVLDSPHAPASGA